MTQQLEETGQDFSIGELAQLAGVTVRALHHYDQIGLVRPGQRTAAGYRCYSSADADRLAQVLGYRELGFGLDSIRAILDEPDTDPYEHLHRQRSLLNERIDRLRRIVAAIDIRDGAAVGSAWTADAAGEDASNVIERLREDGFLWFAVTSTERDGMLSGPDLPALKALLGEFPEACFIASGGIASIEDLRALAQAGMAAAILGRSLYEGRIDLTEALAAAAPIDDPDPRQT